MTNGRVVVLGGGVIGVAAAWYLARSGFEVTLIERREAAALETSFANAGLITPGMSDPWTAPGTPLMVLKWLGREDSPFLLRLGALPGLLSWGVKVLRQCNDAAWRRNTRTILRLCTFSHACLRAVAAETGIDYASNARGTLRLIRDPLAMHKSRRTAAMLQDLGVRSRPLDAAGVIELEPALGGQADSIVGGIHYPDDEAGDAHLFSRRLAAACASRGVTFRYGETVQAIEVQGGSFSGVRTGSGRFDADAGVVALGNESSALLRPLGIRLPIYPVKGYSLTFPVGDWDGAPVVPMSDDGHHVALVRIGDRVRVAGTAELTGYDRTLTPARIEHLRTFFHTLFPDYPCRALGDAWTGLRPMTPDGSPYLGPTPVKGLYVNTGYGHLGWTMACGSASIVAELVGGRDPGIDLSGMTLRDR
ncbi:MAG: D-amino acid dehydrogenase [Candidatus Tectomicrobia bacterium]|nr:D-amino acid dehydrogenase [Candidatus Tectomicrobia bacterium]